MMSKRVAGSPPAIALGTMNFGARTPAAESERIVRRALERGIRVFDTANVYNDGESERILGRALGAERDRVLVATKVGLGRVGGKAEGLSRQAIARAIDGSLQRLGTDRVDLYYLHAPDRAVPVHESVDAMLELVRAGKARAWGVSNYASWQIWEMNDLADGRGLARPPAAQPVDNPRPAAAQLLYNPLHRQLEIEYFAFARRTGIHTTVYNPLAGGLLSGAHRYEEGPKKGTRFGDNAIYQRRYWTRTMFDRVEDLRPVAAAEGLTLVQLAYAWVAARPDVDSILVGPGSVAQLDDAVEAVSRSLSKDALTRLDELGRTWAGTDTNYVR
jgi:aryl-alcohol dehydrogenase-like predicted oxidoreductase